MDLFDHQQTYYIHCAGGYRSMIAAVERRGDPRQLLKATFPQEAQMMDAAAGVHVRFRLGGPPSTPDELAFAAASARRIATGANSRNDFGRPCLHDRLSDRDRVCCLEANTDWKCDAGSVGRYSIASDDRRDRICRAGRDLRTGNRQRNAFAFRRRACRNGRLQCRGPLFQLQFADMER